MKGEKALLPVLSHVEEESFSCIRSNTFKSFGKRSFSWFVHIHMPAQSMEMLWSVQCSVRTGHDTLNDGTLCFPLQREYLLEHLGYPSLGSGFLFWRNCMESCIRDKRTSNHFSDIGASVIRIRLPRNPMRSQDTCLYLN